MTRIPILKPKKVVKIFKKIGFAEVRQTGSHLFLHNRDTNKIVIVPIHSKDIKKGLLKNIIKQSGLTTDQFIKLL